MRPVDSLQAIYDSTPYRDQFFHEFDLARLLGFAELFGVRKPGSSPSGLRVLDLGCATGVHLRRQASRYPHVQFTGIDFSHEEIELGQKEIATAGLENVDLITADLREVEIESGEFDLIVSHGIFSWVPDEVKERMPSDTTNSGKYTILVIFFSSRSGPLNVVCSTWPKQTSERGRQRVSMSALMVCYESCRRISWRLNN
jgi:SAM-dependent methyltransferase